MPSDRIRRLGFGLLRFPFQLSTFLITQLQSLPGAGWARKLFYFGIEAPLMLLVFFVVPPATHPLRDMEGEIQRAGFRLVGGRDYLGGTLKLVRAVVT